VVLIQCSSYLVVESKHHVVYGHLINGITKVVVASANSRNIYIYTYTFTVYKENRISDALVELVGHRY
jgi:transposase-like protein